MTTVSSRSQINISCPHDWYAHVKKLSCATGPDLVSLHPFPAPRSSARAVVSHRNHKHTAKLALSQRTLIWSCIKKTKKKYTLDRWLLISPIGPQIVCCVQKSYDWEDGADEGLTWLELACFETCELRCEEIFSWTGVKLTEERRNGTREHRGTKKKQIVTKKEEIRKRGHWPLNPANVNQRRASSWTQILVSVTSTAQCRLVSLHGIMYTSGHKPSIILVALVLKVQMLIYWYALVKSQPCLNFEFGCWIITNFFLNWSLSGWMEVWALKSD